jgi:hypothetical protein
MRGLIKSVLIEQRNLVNKIPHYVNAFTSSGFYFIRDDRYFSGVNGNEAARFDNDPSQVNIYAKRAASFLLLILKTLVILNVAKAK